MRILNIILVGLILLAIKIPTLGAIEPDPLLIYFSVKDDIDEAFDKSSFNVEGIATSEVVRDIKRGYELTATGQLIRFFILKFPQLPVGEYVIKITVTNKHGLGATKEFPVTVITHTSPEIESDNGKKANTTTNSSTR